MAKVTAIRAAAKTHDAVETVLADDVRAHLDRALTMLDEVQSLISAKDARSAALAYGLLTGARADLTEFYENLC
jgi:hypothetical protein